MTGITSWDERLVRALAEERRGGLVAVWSVAALLVVAGALAGSDVIMVLGTPLAVVAVVATISRSAGIGPAVPPEPEIIRRRAAAHAPVRPTPARCAQTCRRVAAGRVRRTHARQPRP